MRPFVAAARKTGAACPITKVTRRSFLASPRLRAIENEDVPKTTGLNNSKEFIRRIPVGGESVPTHELLKSWDLDLLKAHFKTNSADYEEGKLDDKGKLLYQALKAELARREYGYHLKGIKRLEVGAPKKVLEGFDRLWLRDACDCSICVNSSSKQKTFQTTDIPSNISVKTKKTLPDGSLQFTWENDIPGVGDDHVSTYSKDFLSLYSKKQFTVEAVRNQKPRIHWDNATISRDVTFFDYDTYMSSDTVLYSALEDLRIYGLIFLRGVPSTETAVESIGGRVGNLKDTFYGRTWDVRSVPEAKNVAYTNVSLGFHMDLLYTAEPPGLQLLHCLHNSCEGGNSLFSDSFHAAEQMYNEELSDFSALCNLNITYHYHNAGQHYRNSRPVLMFSGPYSPQNLSVVNYSPPFQGPFVTSDSITKHKTAEVFRNGVKALSVFAKKVEHEDNMFEYKLKEGECVVFNNRRVLHARRAFDIGSGERWLKGAYVDMDVFQSKLRVLHEEREGVTALVPSAGRHVE